MTCPKELLPIAFVTEPETGAVRPIMAVQYALLAMRDAGVPRCIVVTSDRKPEMLRYLGNGADVGVSLAYVNQPEPLGLAAAVDAAFDWVSDCNVCLALPDTVFTPSESLGVVRATLSQTGADLVLGVFPSSDPCQLGPVRLDGDQRVIEVQEKPPSTDLRNTWGVAAWTPAFTAFLHRPLADLRGLSIGHFFNEAIAHGLDVRGVYFASGAYTDLGTGERLAAMVFPQGYSNERPETPLPRARLRSVG